MTQSDMISSITLTLKDPNLQHEYFQKRAKDIFQMSILVEAIATTIYGIVIILSIINKWNEYILELWLGRIIGYIINLILILI